MNIYLTADEIGTPSGGGKVTFHESEAMKEAFPSCHVWGRSSIIGMDQRIDTEAMPWCWDEQVNRYLPLSGSGGGFPGGLCHIYSGTFPKTVAKMKKCGFKVAYTIAAHDRAVSRREHVALGIPFNYPHLVEEPLWQRYIEGYRLADVIVSPSTVAANTIRNYGPDFKDKRIEVIPHGTDVPDGPMAPMPKRFTVGYMGSFGPDKGVRYLLEAWKVLGYRDALLVLAGSDSTTPFGYHMVERFGGGSICLSGWMDNVADFYNSISLLVQPSATEGFGLEVVEALACGRPVLCSEGAGAVDLVPEEWKFPACDAKALARKIDVAKGVLSCNVGQEWYEGWRDRARECKWGKIRKRYVDLWKGLIHEVR